MRCRTKPKEVEAIQYTGDNFKEVNDFVCGALVNGIPALRYIGVILVTENYNEAVDPGYWIVKHDEYDYRAYCDDEFKENFETL